MGPAGDPYGMGDDSPERSQATSPMRIRTSDGRYLEPFGYRASRPGGSPRSSTFPPLRPPSPYGVPPSPAFPHPPSPRPPPYQILVPPFGFPATPSHTSPQVEQSSLFPRPNVGYETEPFFPTSSPSYPIRSHTAAWVSPPMPHWPRTGATESDYGRNDYQWSEHLDKHASEVSSVDVSSITQSSEWMEWVLYALASLSLGKEELEKFLDTLPTHRTLSRLIAHAIFLTSLPDFSRAPFRSLAFQQAQIVTALLDSVLRRWDQYVYLLGSTFSPSSTARPTLTRILIDTAHEHEIFPRSLCLRGVALSDNPFGGGTFADVYKGTWGDQPVAVKQLRKVVLKEKAMRCLFREAFTGAYLTHPNVLYILGIDQEGHEQYSRLSIITPWMEHGSVRAYMSNLCATTRMVSSWVRDIVLGMAYLHEIGVIHSDLRGTNVLVNEKYRAVVADYGQAFLLDDPLRDLTNAGGSSQWMAPELLNPDLFNTEFRPSKEADVYAFACVVIELYQRENPWKNLSDFQVHTEVMAGNRPAIPNSGVEGVNSELWTMVKKCWAHERSQRPAMQDVANFIDNIFNIQ